MTFAEMSGQELTYYAVIIWFAGLGGTILPE